MALFVTFEGGEGSGKSFQAKTLYKRLYELAIPVLLVHEPGITPLGKRIARLLKWARDFDISPMAELMLFNTSRAQLVTEIIRPGLERGQVVICDRYADSTMAYQGYGRGLDSTVVKAVNEAGTLGLTPNFTILLDMPIQQSLTRKKHQKRDRFEQEALAFHRRVRDGYLNLAAAEPERWFIIDGTKSKDEIAGIIWHKVSQLLSGEKGA